MTKPIITYFDFPGGRGEDCRVALHVAGVDFEDDRIKSKEWSDRKGDTPHGALPVLTIDGRKLGESNAILTFVGRQHGLHPTDAWDAAQHEAIMGFVEELRYKLPAATRSETEETKKASREEFAEGYLKMWAKCVEGAVVGPFLGGDTMNVADLKLAGIIGWFQRGGADYISPTYFETYPKLTGLHAAVHADERVKSWYAE